MKKWYFFVCEWKFEILYGQLFHRMVYFFCILTFKWYQRLFSKTSCSCPSAIVGFSALAYFNKEIMQYSCTIFVGNIISIIENIHMLDWVMITHWWVKMRHITNKLDLGHSRYIQIIVFETSLWTQYLEKLSDFRNKKI